MSDDAGARLLLVDNDADRLAALATALRARGFIVALANGTPMACERARSAHFDVLVAPAELVEDDQESPALLEALALIRGQTFPHILLVRDPEAAWGEHCVLRSDVDTLASRATAIASGAVLSSSRLRAFEPVAAEVAREDASLPDGAQTGNLSLTPLLDVARALFDRRSSGTLAVTTARGAGELRVSRGELVDIVYLRMEGTKALLRMLGESDGAFVFTSGTPVVMRRLTASTAELLNEATGQLQHAQRLRAALGVADDAEPAAFIAIDGVEVGELSVLARSLLARVRAPTRLDDLLDDAPEPDTDLLAALVDLQRANRLRRVGAFSTRLPFVASEQLERVKALAARARALGFEGPARIVFAATPNLLAVLAHTVLRLEEAVAPGQPPPTVPAPHEMATLRLSDGIALELLALPLVPAYSPLWPMSLAGAAVVVRLDEAASDVLRRACAAVDVRALDAQALIGGLDESSIEQVGNLVRSALEASEA